MSAVLPQVDYLAVAHHCPVTVRASRNAYPCPVLFLPSLSPGTCDHLATNLFHSLSLQILSKTSP